MKFDNGNEEKQMWKKEDTSDDWKKYEDYLYKMQETLRSEKIKF